MNKLWETDLSNFYEKLDRAGHGLNQLFLEIANRLEKSEEKTERLDRKIEKLEEKVRELEMIING